MASPAVYEFDPSRAAAPAAVGQPAGDVAANYQMPPEQAYVPPPSLASRIEHSAPVRWFRHSVPDWLKWTACCVAIFLIALLVPLSYHGVPLNNYGLDRNALTNSVSYDRVYSNGLYFTGLSHDFVLFPSSFQFMELINKDMTVINSDGLSYSIQVSLQWRIRQEAVPQLHRSFRQNIEPQVRSRLRTAIATAMNTFDMRDMITNRSKIDRRITAEVAARLDEIGIEVPPEKFQLDTPILPETVAARFLDTQVQLIRNEEAVFKQAETAVRQSTQVDVNAILANATRIRDVTGTTVVARIDSATSVAQRMVEEARLSGLQLVFDAMNVTSTQLKQRLALVLAARQPANLTIYKGLPSNAPLVSV